MNYILNAKLKSSSFVPIVFHTLIRIEPNTQLCKNSNIDISPTADLATRKHQLASQT